MAQPISMKKAHHVDLQAVITNAATLAVLARKRTTSAAERFTIKEEYFSRAGYSKPAIAMWERIVGGSFVPDQENIRNATRKRLPHGRAILVVHPDGSTMTFETQLAAAMALHVSAATITFYLQGKVHNPMFNVRPVARTA